MRLPSVTVSTASCALFATDDDDDEGEDERTWVSLHVRHVMLFAVFSPGLCDLRNFRPVCSREIKKKLILLSGSSLVSSLEEGI